MIVEPIQMLYIAMIVLSAYMSYTNEASNYPDKTADQIVYDTTMVTFFVVALCGMIFSVANNMLK